MKGKPTGTANYNRDTGILTIKAVNSKGVENRTYYRVANLDPDPSVAFPAFSLSKARVIRRKSKMSQAAIEAGLKEEVIFDSSDVWHIAIEEYGASCSCPHALFRGANTSSVCKHILAARAVGLLPKSGV